MQVDAAAASCAASRGLSPAGDEEKDPAQEVLAQIRIATRTLWGRLRAKVKFLRNRLRNGTFKKRVARWYLRLRGKEPVFKGSIRPASLAPMRPAKPGSIVAK